MNIRQSSTRRSWAGIASIALLISALAQGSANAADQCGVTGGHDVCFINVPTEPLSGATTITIQNNPNSGVMVLTWLPTGSPTKKLMQRAGPSGVTGDYSFVWPTNKYLDGSGKLKAKIGSTGPGVQIPVTLSNGNTSDFQHTPNDWDSFLPGAWSGGADPIVGAVGDGADDRPTANSLSGSIVAEDPALLLYLGDIYEDGSFTENLNMYGSSSMDGSGSTLWGRLAHKTQPTLGNHEASRKVDWKDYFHGRPLFTSFMFGGVLFLDLNSSASFLADGQQYAFVQEQLQTAPQCVVTFWHIPALSGGTINTTKAPMWSLLANNGGDLVLNGHNHFMMEYLPLDAAFQPGGHMVELISGAGGHKISNPKTDTEGRIAWSSPAGKPAGVLYLTLEGAADGGTATSMTWAFEKTNGTVLRTGSVTC